MNSTKSVSHERVVLLQDKPAAGAGRYVFYWMQSAQRAEDNPALEFAAQQANSLALPLVVGFCLKTDYPEANLRHYTFMLEGLFETFGALREHKILPILKIGNPPQEMAKLAEQAAVAVLDKGYLRHLQAWYKEFANSAKCRVFQVEGEAVVPVELASQKAEYAARTIRPRINRYLPEFLVGLLPTRVETPPSELPLESPEVERGEVGEFLKDFDLDRSVRPVSQFFRGGTAEAKKGFQKFLDSLLLDYDVQRNQPQTSYTSHMSPYLHYGMVSPVYLAVSLLESKSPKDENVESYLEELIVRRGLSQNFTHFEAKYDSFECLPPWAVTTLAAHSQDPRPDLSTREQLELAESHDPYWNAAQIEMVETGYMHNYMRMYWGKKILEWSASPQEAYQTTLYLNNKYLLDGRDPASYGNVGWIYGLHDRAWQERAIYGKIRCMMASGLERKNDPKAYVDKIERMTGRKVAAKDWLC